MSELNQFRELAEQVRPPSLDSLRETARRRDRRSTMAAATLAATTVVLVIVSVVVDRELESSEPDPAISPSENGLISVHGVVGDGGLRLESDLAVGPANAVVTNDTDVFVITADDGAYHRLRLPGYDPALHDGSLDDAERPGVALSPDGRRLAYAWHKPILTDQPPWEESYLVPSGVRVLDLTTGAFAFEDEVPLHSPHHTFWSVELDSHLRWSSDGRYVAYYYSFGIYAGDWVTEGIDVEVLDTTGRVGSVQDPPFSRLMDDTQPYTPFASAKRAAVVVDDRLFAWHPDGSATGPPMAIGDGWGSGAFATSRRVLLGPLGFGDSLLDVDLQTRQQVEVRVLDPERWPEGATIELLGTAGPDTAIASVHRIKDGKVGKDASLVMLELSRAGGEPATTEVGRVTDTSGNAFSFATRVLADNILRTDSGELSGQGPGPSSDTESSPTQDPTGQSNRLRLSLAVVGLAFGAAVALAIRRRRRS